VLAATLDKSKELGRSGYPWYMVMMPGDCIVKHPLLERGYVLMFIALPWILESPVARFMLGNV